MSLRQMSCAGEQASRLAGGRVRAAVGVAPIALAALAGKVVAADGRTGQRREVRDGRQPSSERKVVRAAWRTLVSRGGHRCRRDQPRPARTATHGRD